MMKDNNQSKSEVRSQYSNVTFCLHAKGRSMWPLIKEGMMLRVRFINGGCTTKCKKVCIGDIVVRRFDQRLVVHRVIASQRKDNETLFLTKGDCVALADAIWLSGREICGKVVVIERQGGSCVQLHHRFWSFTGRIVAELSLLQHVLCSTLRPVASIAARAISVSSYGRRARLLSGLIGGAILSLVWLPFCWVAVLFKGRNASHNRELIKSSLGKSHFLFNRRESREYAEFAEFFLCFLRADSAPSAVKSGGETEKDIVESQ